MRTILGLALVLAACTKTSATEPVRAPPLDLTSAEGRSTAASIDAFAADLHAALPKHGNLVYSPASVAMALGLAEQGASGATRAEMDKVLHVSGGTAAFAQLESALGSRVSIADRLYLERSLAIEPAFARVAPSERVDFEHDPDGARLAIDAWVSNQTHARIPELIAQGQIRSDARFVVVDAVYFKGEWANRFDARATRDEVFHGDADETVPTMHATLSAGYGAHAGAHVLDLPYRADHGPALSMTIVLPDSTSGLAAVEATYEKEGIAPFAAAATSTRDVEIALPKTKMTSSFELRDALSSMGMPLAFDDAADFTRVTRSEPLKIGQVVHQAFVEVNEEGTEAAAATGVVGIQGAAVELPTVFRADHPFLFFVRDRASGVVLFAGRCEKP